MAIYFLTPDYTHPSGGVRVIYRHVDILNVHGIKAYVLHTNPGFRCEWFDNTTLIAYQDKSLLRKISSKILKQLNKEQPHEIHLINGTPTKKLTPTDYLVLPEIYGPTMTDMAPGVPKVILNQGCYLTFQGYSLEPKDLTTAYHHPDVKGTLINSQDGADYLHYVFPNLNVGRFHLSLDSNLFRFQKTKKRQICFPTKKGEMLLRQLINILKFRNALHDFELVPFADISQQEVAKIMQDSAIFLNFSQYEGFGLPPLEAMACGCIVIGFHAEGGREFFQPEFSYPIENGHIINFAKTVEQVIQAFNNTPEKMATMSKAASDYALTHYTPQQEESDILDFWKKIL